MDENILNIDGKKYIRLYVSTPIHRQGTHTSEKDVLPKQTFWKHANGCNGNIFLGEDALCFCDKCHTRSHIRNWRIVCDNFSSTNKAGNEEELESHNCVAIAGEMVKKGGISWLKFFLNSMVAYTPDKDQNLVMQPCMKQESDHNSSNQQETSDTFEVPIEYSQEQQEETAQTDSHNSDSDFNDSEIANIEREATEKKLVEREDNANFDSSSFDESSFFERFSQKNNK